MAVQWSSSGLVVYSVQWSSSGTNCHMMPLHYRLRDSIRFLNVKKKSKCKRRFLIQETSKTDHFAHFDFDINSFQNVFSACVDKVQMAKRSDKCLEKPERGLRRS